MADQVFRIEYTSQVWQEDDQYIAHAMPLDLMSAGATPEEARKALDEAVQLFLATAAEAGTIAEVLQEAGYRRERGRWAGPLWIGVERHSVAVGA